MKIRLNKHYPQLGLMGGVVALAILMLFCTALLGLFLSPGKPAPGIGD